MSGVRVEWGIPSRWCGQGPTLTNGRFGTNIPLRYESLDAQVSTLQVAMEGTTPRSIVQCTTTGTWRGLSRRGLNRRTPTYPILLLCLTPGSSLTQSWIRGCQRDDVRRGRARLQPRSSIRSNTTQATDTTTPMADPTSSMGEDGVPCNTDGSGREAQFQVRSFSSPRSSYFCRTSQVERCICGVPSRCRFSLSGFVSLVYEG